MAKIDFPKKQEQRLIPKYLLEYAEELQESHPDPSADWGGGGGSPIEAGTGIEITGDETKTISVDTETIPTVSELSTVAFSGSYSDLSNKPDLSVYELKEDAFSGDYEDLTHKPDLSVYELKSEAFSGDYNDLTNKPSIPTKTSDLTNDSGYITGVTWNDVTGKPTFATVATTGDYDDLLDKPDLSVYELKTDAFSGDYNDLTNKPTIPTVNNATISLYQGNTFKGSFTVNQNNNASIYLDAGSSNVPHLTDNSITGLATEATAGSNLKPSIIISDFTTSIPTNYKLVFPEKNGTIATLSDLPTKTSDLTNDSGFITSSALSGYATETWVGNQGYLTSVSWSDVSNKPTFATVATSGDYDDLTNKPTIPTVPTNISAFTNDAGYITSSALPTNYVTTDTAQTITGQKTFTGNVYITGDKLLKLKSGNDARGVFTGFTAYDTSNNEYGNLQIGKRSINFGSGASDRFIVSLGNYSTTYTGANKPLVGFRAQDQSNTSINFVMPTTNFSTNFTGADTFYMPMMVNGTKADSDGNINIAVPTTATSTSTVTPTTSAFMTSTTKTTETLTFTYSDDTTANITIVTSITDNTSNAMTGATVATTTTLS